MFRLSFVLICHIKFARCDLVIIAINCALKAPVHYQNKLKSRTVLSMSLVHSLTHSGEHEVVSISDFRNRTSQITHWTYSVLWYVKYQQDRSVSQTLKPLLRPPWRKRGGSFNNCVKDFPRCLQVLLVAHVNSSDSVGGNVSHFLLSMKRPLKRSAIMGNDESVAFGRITSHLFWDVRLSIILECSAERQYWSQ